MPLSIEYVLTGAGWAECSVRHNATTCKISASYLSDALGKLVLAALAIASGAHSVSVGFDEEPGEFRWVVEHLSSGHLKVRVMKFQDLWSFESDDHGEQLMAFEVPPLEFAEAVARAAGNVLSGYGEAGYKERWVEHEFPARSLSMLNEVLDRWHRRTD